MVDCSFIFRLQDRIAIRVYSNESITEKQESRQKQMRIRKACKKFCRNPNLKKISKLTHVCNTVFFLINLIYYVFYTELIGKKLKNNYIFQSVTMITVLNYNQSFSSRIRCTIYMHPFYSNIDIRPSNIKSF